MEKELIRNLSEDYEINQKTIIDMAKIILSCDGVTDDNFEIILETAVSRYSSTKPMADNIGMPYIKRGTIKDSIQYALNLEIYNNIDTMKKQDKIR